MPLHPAGLLRVHYLDPRARLGSLWFPEQYEFLELLPESEFKDFGGKQKILDRYLEVARVTADFYLRETPTDGIPYWDTGAPGLVHLGDYLNRPAEPLTNMNR